MLNKICILAHVDHGKTSLSDCLLATNGIISPKLAGRVRYLDSRPDEQLRGITMESSAVSLFFKMMRRKSDLQDPVPEDYLINLIDSPGHVDFSSEVSTASRLCDGAIILVDAVEGVCSQTVTVLRQTWVEQIRPVLVVNKMDRLITEIKLSPSEAYSHLSKLLEQINAVMGSFFAGERMEDDLKWRETKEKRLAKHAAESAEADIAPDAEGTDFHEKDDEDIYFSPEKGNVIFASAIDGWAFTIKQFAAIYAKKLGFKREVLENVLWGDFYLDPKTKRVLGQKHLRGRNLKPMFVQLVLESIWAIYDSTVLRRDQEKIEKIVKSLGLKIIPRDLKSKDTRSLLSTVFMQWLPLSTALLVTVIEKIPSPVAAQSQRMPFLLKSVPGASDISPEIQSVMTCFTKDNDAPAVAYVSKMVAVPESELIKTSRAQISADEMREIGQRKRIALARKIAEETTTDQSFHKSDSQITASGSNSEEYDIRSGSERDPSDREETKETIVDDKEKLIGFARLYSGNIKVGQELFVLGPKYTPSRPYEHISRIIVSELYYFMGRELQVLDEVPAGNVFGIGGLDGKIFKNGTLCSVEKGLNLAGVNMGGAPIVRVALEPKNPSELNKMIEGLRLLEQADPCAEYTQQSNGEHVILTAGELHLERCLKDLRERYAKVEIQASAPIVPFRETIVSASDSSTPKDKDTSRGTVNVTTPSKTVSMVLQVRPLPPAVTDYLTGNSLSIKRLFGEQKDKDVSQDTMDVNESEGTPEMQNDGVLLEGSKSRILSLTEFKDGLLEAFKQVSVSSEREFWKSMTNRIVAFGPRRIGPNILIDDTGAQLLRPIFLSDSTPVLHTISIPTNNDEVDDASTGRAATIDLGPHILHAFQLFTSSGPLCAEPTHGIAVLIKSPPVTPSAMQTISPAKLTGELVPATTAALRTGFLDWSPRLLLATYSCTILCPTDVLGKVYATVTKRRGVIVSEEMKEGTPFFEVSARIPVVESWGFGDDIRKRTSGAAAPQLVWAGWELLDQDPFWVPSTEDELEDLGEKGDKEVLAKRYMDSVRTRKGLFVQRKVVAAAEKQKTLKR